MEKLNTKEKHTPQTSIMSDFSACFKYNTGSLLEPDDWSIDNFNTDKVSWPVALRALLSSRNNDC